MMKLQADLSKNVIIFGVPFLIIGLLMVIANSVVFKSNVAPLSTAITLDLLLTVPFVYFLLIRKTKIPKTTVVFFFVLGLIICSYIIPQENQYVLDLAKTWVLPIVEISVVSFIIYKVRKAIKHYKATKNTSEDFFTALKNTCSELLPKVVVIPFVTEIAVVYYGFINWKQRELANNEFSYHKNTGTSTLLFAFVFIIIIETIVLHLLLMGWNNLVAWILTGLSIYTAIQVFGYAKSLSQRPISITKNVLCLRYGIMSESNISLNSIESVALSSKSIEKDSETRHLSFLGEMEGHNVVLHLKESQTLVGLYGFKKQYKTIAFHVDDSQRFVEVLNQNLQNHI